MNQIFHYDSPVGSFLTNLADLFLLNLFWLIGCLPIITIGTSTAALYYCLIRKADGENISPARDFWYAFRENFRQSLILELFVAFCLSAFGIYIYLIVIPQGETPRPTLAFFLLYCLAVLPALGFLFPLQARFQNKTIQTVKNAWLLALAHPLVALSVMILNLLPLFAALLVPELFWRVAVLWVLLGKAVTADIASHLLLKMWRKHTDASADTKK